MTTAPNEPKNLIPTFPQLNRKARGHNFYGAELKKAPALYVTEEIPAENKTVIAHYFSSNSDWWIVEVDKESGTVFGYTIMNGWTDDAEWGYSDLIAMESLMVGRTLIERDCHWTPTKFSEIERANS